MPVQRFGDPEEARRALWRDPSDPRLLSVIRSLWHRSAALAGHPSYQRGVRRYRSIEEANADRDRLVDERIRKIRSSRGEA